MLNLLIIMLALGVLSLIIGIFGLVGSVKDNNCCLRTFSVLIGPIGLFFIAIAVAGVVISQMYIKKIDDQQQQAPSQCNSRTLQPPAAYVDCSTKYCGQGIDILDGWLAKVDQSVLDAAYVFGSN